MSLRIMAQVWDASVGSHTAKLVLLALADNANDAGVCWPSIPTIARKCDLSTRGVMKILASLESDGHLTRQKNAGKSTVYTVQPVNRVHPCPPFTGEHGSPAPLNAVHPNPGTPFTPPVNPVHVTPEHGSPEPSRTVSEPRERESRAPEREPIAEPAPVHRPDPHAASRPTLEQAIAAGSQIGMPADKATLWWNKRASADWRRSAGGESTIIIGANWRSDQSQWWNGEKDRANREARFSRTPAGATGSTAPADPSQPTDKFAGKTDW